MLGTAQLPTTVRHLLIITTRAFPPPPLLSTTIAATSLTSSTTRTKSAAFITSIVNLADRRRALTTQSSFITPVFRPAVGDIYTRPTAINPTTKTKYIPHQSLGFHSSSAKMVHEIKSKAEFHETLEKANKKLVVIDCYATWCGPCRLIAPKVVAFSQEYSDADFYKLDVDEVSDVAAELGVRAMPTFYLFKGGEKVQEVVGANPSALKAAIEKHK